MTIVPTQQSRLQEVDFDNLSFGTVFTDHMFVCDFKNGTWNTPEIIPYGPFSMHPSASVLHYGQAVFEGMKAYKDSNNEVWLFRPDQNIQRMNKSAKRLAIPEFPENLFHNGLMKLVDMDRDWIQPGRGNSLYIRPFVFASQAGVQASPSNEYRLMIICAPVSSYYSGGEVRVKIADHFSRAPQGGTGYAKAAGNYGGQFYPTQLAINEGYQQVIWTDAATHEYVEEAGTMNLFFHIGDKLITAPTSDSILDGVTRKSIIQLAQDLGLEVEIRPLRVSELLDAQKSGDLKEIFGSGTAVVIQPIHGFGYKDQDFDLKPIQNGLAETLKSKLIAIQYNEAPDSHGWRVQV